MPDRQSVYDYIEANEPIDQDEVFKHFHPEAFCDECGRPKEDVDVAAPGVKAELKDLIEKDIVEYSLDWKLITTDREP